MKKTILLGIIAVFFIFTFLFFALSETSENTSNYTQPKDEIIENTTEDIFEGFSIHVDDERIVNGGLIVSVNGDGSLETSVILRALAIQTSFFERWIILQDYPRILQFNDTPMLVYMEPVDGMTYNNIFVYIPEIHVLEDNILKPVIMFRDRFFLSGEIINVLPGSETPSYLQITMLKNESILKTTEGDYIFVPTFQVNFWVNASIVIEYDLSVTMEHGKLWSAAVYGTDVDGQTGIGLRVKPGDSLRVGEQVVRLA